MEKLYNDKGQVAVAISSGFGAGWSTWNNKVNPMDKRFNELILNGDIDKLKEICKKEDIYAGGLDEVSIVWVEPDTAFVINEYDGSESINYRDSVNWFIA